MTPATELASTIARSLVVAGYVASHNAGRPRDDGPLFATVKVEYVPEGELDARIFHITVEETP